jgi:hypothetical protein
MNNSQQQETSYEIPFVELLNANHASLIHIEGAYYTFTSFEPADNDNHYTTLIGRNVTQFVDNHLQYDKIVLFQKIEEIPIKRREFHPSIKWRKYAATGN